MGIHAFFIRIIIRLLRKFIDPKIRSRHLRALFLKLTWKKFFNFIHAEINKRLRNPQPENFPYYLNVDVTNACNLRCPFCPTGQRLFGREKKMLSLELFKKMIDELYPWLFSCDLYNWGEPFLHKDLFKMIAYAEQKKIYTAISTNLNIFNQDLAEKTVQSGLDHMILGIDGLNEEYNKYRINGNFNNVVNNIKMLVRTKKRLKSRKPYLEWQFVVFRHNEHQLEEAYRLSRELGVDEFYPLEPYMEDKTWTPKSKKFRTEVSYAPSTRKCGWLWTHVIVNPDGGVAPCCWEFYKKDDFGMLDNKSVMEIWHNKNFQNARRLFHLYHRKKDVSYLKKSTVCYDCLVNRKVPFHK